MRIKVFSAPRLHEALAKVRQEMGPDALILDRQQSEDGKGGSLWHVHAALDHQEKVATPNPYRQPSHNRTTPASAQVAAGGNADATLDRLERIVKGLGSRESEGLRAALSGADEQKAFDHLIELGVTASYAFDMAGDFACRNPLGQKSMRWGNQIHPRQEAVSMLFSGPSGSGKTTLIAKLAAHYSLKGIRVVLLSTDTERMGGLDLLKAYANTLGIDFFPIRKVADADKFREKADSAQLLLIDSEGWSPRRDGSLKRQRELWSALGCNRRFLLLPATMDEEDGMQQIEHQAAVEMSDIAFSRLDETQKPGKIINWAFATQLPVSYCSFGPEVPEQMGWLNPGGLTALLGSRPGTASA